MDELFDFLSHERLDVRHEATKLVAGLTNDKSNFEHFKLKNFKPILDLMNLCKEEPLTAHDALSALINLTAELSFIATMATTEFINDLLLLLILPKNVNADLCCMLLNNLSKYDAIKNILLPIEESDSAQPGTHRLDNLLEIFVRGETNVYNPSASFHFLAGVFANITTSPQGCSFFLSNSTVDGSERMSKLIVFTEHKDVIRRGGVLAAIKNICFGASLAEKGIDVLLSDNLNLMVYILLPLSGPEDYDEDEMEGMPFELQLLEPEKKRESDPTLRILLMEIILSICGSRLGRDYCRNIKVYPVIKKLHLQEKNEEVSELIEKVVNMIMRDESNEP